jgi:hypothetical protein
MATERHPGKKHIRFYPRRSFNPAVWAEQNVDRIKSFVLDVRADPRNAYIDVFYAPGQETLIIEEVLRYAGVVDVCRIGSYLD